MGDFRRFLVKRKGFTLIELLVVVAIIALLISILLPSLARARELAKRAVCRANMRGVGQASYIYANDYEESFPVAYYKATQTGTDNGVLYAGLMGGGSGTDNENTNGPDVRKEIIVNTSNVQPKSNQVRFNGQIPVSRSLFLLVIQNATTPKQFICPSAGDTADNLRNVLDGTGTNNETASQPGFNRFDFWGYANLSYGYQHPYNSAVPPNTDMDVRMALGADKGPFFVAAARKDEGIVPNGGTPDLPFTQGDSNLTGEQILREGSDDWQRENGNSVNHNGEGQSVLFADGHVDFEDKPIVGANNDNIYTIQPDPSESSNDALKDVLSGKRAPQIGHGYVPVNQTDSVIVP